MIAAVQPQPQTETFQVGDYIAPTWTAGVDRRGVVTKLISKGKRSTEWWAEVKWLVGREAGGSTGTIAFRQLRLIWRPAVGQKVKLKNGGYQTNEITKIHDTGELQLKPHSGHSFKVGLEAIVISEESSSPVQPEDDEAEAWAIAQVSVLQAGAHVVSLVPVRGTERLQIAGVRSQEAEHGEASDPKPDLEVEADKYIFGDNPTFIDQATFDEFEETYSADRLMENKIKSTFHWQEREFICTGYTSSGELDAVEVVALEDWDRELYSYQQLCEKDTFSYAGQVVKHKRRALVLTDLELHFAVAPTQDSELRTQDLAVESQESAVSSYEYTPIEPTPVWFSPNGDAANIVEGQAIATNVKGNVRIVWDEEQRESDIPGQKVHWVKPEPQLTAGFQSVPLSLIAVDPELQPRVQMDEFAIAEYAEAMAAGAWDWQKDPMIAYWDGTSLLLSSGGHRYQGAVRAGLQYISLEVRLGDRSEALLNAPCANMQHGVRMTSADKNRAIALILRDPKWQKEASRALSRMLTERGFRVDHKKIEQIRQGMMTSGAIPQIEQRTVRRGGQTYTTTAPAVRQDQHSLEEVKELYAELGEFSINGDPAKPYKFECIGVLQRFKSLDEAYDKFAWMRERVAEKQKEYETTCVDCAKRSDLANGEFECSAFSRIHAVTDDPGAAGCRYYNKKRWCDYPESSEAPRQSAAFVPFNPAIERPEPPAGTVVTGYSAKDGEEDLQLTGSVVATDGDRLRLENGGMVYRDSVVVEPDSEQAQAAAREGLKQAIARWALVNKSGWHNAAIEVAMQLVESVLSDYKFQERHGSTD